MSYQDPRDPSWAFGDQAGSHANLAIARVAGRDLDGAAAALAPVLDLAPDQRINGIITSVKHVHRALVAGGLATDGRAMIEEIEAFTHTPLTSRPS
jgi:hypothetical protein